ncbi:hypothetical protein CDAR_570231 [Caerostris darwini]|uniref:Uncharacterized protein n=1 Tax=Caerostris darwini TaxID=1538125 RepID=A0AAV4WBK2_9ARAC|nr:hypothetical protein CDAR_570231 [Caerostris darwini]
MEVAEIIFAPDEIIKSQPDSRSECNTEEESRSGIDDKSPPESVERSEKITSSFDREGVHLLTYWTHPKWPSIVGTPLEQKKWGGRARCVM